MLVDTGADVNIIKINALRDDVLIDNNRKYQL
jgi:hypothetical protein